MFIAGPNELSMLYFLTGLASTACHPVGPCCW